MDILITWQKGRMKEYFENTGKNLLQLWSENKRSHYALLNTRIDNKVSLPFQMINKPKKEDYTIVCFTA